MAFFSFIFDCDGTLIDSYGAIVDRVERLFAGHGITVPASLIRSDSLQHDVGWCIDRICKANNLNSDELKQECGRMTENHDLITLMPDCRKMLSSLADLNCRSYVYTHRGASTGRLFEKLDIARYFIETVDSTYGFQRKPSGEAIDYLVTKYGLDRDRTFYVGDRALDIECGRNGGIRTVFLKSSGLEIDSREADYTISGLMDLIGVLNTEKTKKEKK